VTSFILMARLRPYVITSVIVFCRCACGHRRILGFVITMRD
jgi:hypothetical protein